jgi:hypothetical protein
MCYIKKNLIDHHRTLFLFAIITMGVFTYLIRLLYEGYGSRSHIKALKSCGIVGTLYEDIMCLLD